jgi:dihydroflavonol-4-reductase
MKVLLTGISGFVGSTLCDQLNLRDHKVKALVRSNSSKANIERAEFEPVLGDLRHPESLLSAVADVDVVYHVAGLVTARSKEEFFAANEQGTRNLLSACLKGRTTPPHFVYVSSLAAAGPSSPSRPHEEGDICAPVSNYGASKLAGEKACLAEAAKLPITILRPPAVYGPRDKGMFTFFQSISRGLLPLLKDNSEPRRFSFIHVEDLAQGILQAGQRQLNSAEVFYLTGPETPTWPEAMGLITAALERQPLRFPLAPSVLRLAAFACDGWSSVSGKALPLSSDKYNELVAPAWTCSGLKAESMIGFRPSWKLADGLKQTAQWYKLRGWL